MIKPLFASYLICSFASSLSAQKIPIPELARQSVAATWLTAPGNAAFHLKATIAIPEETKTQGSLEEYWISPTKWRRTIQVPTFSQTVIVNGDQRYEKNEGMYFPIGLQTLSDALVQPIPDWLEQGLALSKVKLNFYGGKLGNTNMCDGNQQQVGSGNARNLIFNSVCFTGTPPLIGSIRFPFYDVVFENRQPFGELSVARHLKVGENGGIKWEARVEELSEITSVDETLFALPEVTPTKNLLQVLQLPEERFRQHFKDLPGIEWPALAGKGISGTITVFFGLDKEGYVAEAWPSNCGYPEVGEALKQQVLHWQLGAPPKGTMMQLNSYLTFAFKTKVATDQPAASHSPKQ